MIDSSMLTAAWAWFTARMHHHRGERGQSTLEYIIIAAIVSVAAVGVAVYIVAQINDAKRTVVTH